MRVFAMNIYTPQISTGEYPLWIFRWEYSPIIFTWWYSPMIFTWEYSPWMVTWEYLSSLTWSGLICCTQEYSRLTPCSCTAWLKRKTFDNLLTTFALTKSAPNSMRRKKSKYKERWASYSFHLQGLTLRTKYFTDVPQLWNEWEIYGNILWMRKHFHNSPFYKMSSIPSKRYQPLKIYHKNRKSKI